MSFLLPVQYCFCLLNQNNAHDCNDHYSYYCRSYEPNKQKHLQRQAKHVWIFRSSSTGSGKLRLVSFMSDDYPNNWQDETEVEDGVWYHVTALHLQHQVCIFFNMYICIYICVYTHVACWLRHNSPSFGLEEHRHKNPASKVTFWPPNSAVEVKLQAWEAFAILSTESYVSGEFSNMRGPQRCTQHAWFFMQNAIPDFGRTPMLQQLRAFRSAAGAFR